MMHSLGKNSIRPFLFKILFAASVLALGNGTDLQATGRPGYPLYCIPQFEKFRGLGYPHRAKETGPGSENNHFEYGYEIEYPVSDLEKT